MNVLSTIEGISYDAGLANKVPEHLRDGIYRYIVHGIKPGSFLLAVIQNDLFHAVGSAGEPLTLDDLRTVTRFFYWCAPAECFGSPEKFAAWQSRGGMQEVAA